MQELVRLRQQQQATDSELQSIVQQLEGMEQRQQHMMSFLVKAVCRPGIFAQFVLEQNENKKPLNDGTKKRRIERDDGTGVHSVAPVDGQVVKYHPLINDAADTIIKQIIKLDASMWLENCDSNSDTNLVNDGESFGALNDGNSPNCTLGLALQEVPPVFDLAGIPGQGPPPSISEPQSLSHGPNSKMVVTTSVSGDHPLAEVEVSSPPLVLTDSGRSQLSPLHTIVRESSAGMSSDYERPVIDNGALTNLTSLQVNGRMPFDIDKWSSNPELEWDISLLEEEIHKLTDIENWECLETEEMNSSSRQDSLVGTDTRMLENGLNQVQHVGRLTKEMGPLKSDAKDV